MIDQSPVTSPLKSTLEQLGTINSKQKMLYDWLNKIELTDIHSVREAKERINLILELEIKKEVLLDMATRLSLDT